MISFRVYGEPAPQGSKRHVGGGRMIESSKKLPAWRKAVTQAARQVAPKQPLDEPVTVAAVFWLPRPKKPRWNVPAGPPDTDKLQRAIGDALEQAGLIKNDSRIIKWENPEKRWSTNTEPPGAHITITPLTGCWVCKHGQHPCNCPQKEQP